MKNNNEILSILEDEFVRLIGICDYSNSYKVYEYNTWPRIDELIVLCEKLEIPFDWEVSRTDDNTETIDSITISGKRIEFD